MYKIKIKRLYLINKLALANCLFMIGVLLAFYESLHPWFLWSLGPYAYLFMAFCMAGSSLLAKSLNEDTIFTNKESIPFLLYSMLSVCIFLVNPDATFMAFISVALQIFFYYYLFLANEELFRNTMRFITISFSILLCISLFGFALYLLNFSLPYRDAQFGDNLYSFSNYYLFLIDDRSLFVLFPRFQSVFLEPSHMAIAAVFLLMTESGNWGKWYNIIIIISVVISFSLEAYVLFFCLVFLSKWIQRQYFMRNLIAITLFFMAIVVGSFFYNNGDNMLNSMIVMRLEISDGEVAGNNRTTTDFDVEYESFLGSSDIVFGRDMDGSFGNSGYKVFIYENGIANLFLLFLLYGAILYNRNNKRAAFTAFVLTFIHFIVRAHMTWASCIIPMYYMAQFYKANTKEKVYEESSDIEQQ